MRHRYDDVGFPCRNTTGTPAPDSAYAMNESLTSIVFTFGVLPRGYLYVVGHGLTGNCDNHPLLAGSTSSDDHIEHMFESWCLIEGFDRKYQNDTFAREREGEGEGCCSGGLRALLPLPAWRVIRKTLGHESTPGHRA